MRIVYCIPHLYNSGGMERVLTQKVNWLAAHTDNEITIVTTELTPTGQSDTYFALDKRISVEALQIDFNVDYAKPLFNKWFGHMRRMRAYEQALANYIRANEIDLCISLGGKEVAFISSLPCRTMVEFHFAKDHRQQLLDANHTSFLWHLLGRIRTWQLVRDVRGVERIVVLTENDQQDWQRAGCSNVVCIPNPCAIKDKEPKDKGERTNTILAVGRLHEQKGFDMLLNVWQQIEKVCPEWVLRIVGEGPQRVALEKQIKDLGLQRVCLAGRTNNMVDEYAAASVFVLSSRYEGLPLALIEAMWCGLPCVSFDCPHGPAELIGDDRGWIVPNGDIQALQNNLEYVMRHPNEAQERARCAQAYARAVYSEDAIMPRWVEIVERRRASADGN